MSEIQAGLFPDTTAQARKVPLHEQAECASRELAMRHRVYPGLVARGKMTDAEAAREIDAMRAVRDTLQLFAGYEAEIRDALRSAIKRQKDLESIKAHPAVEAVLEAFPDAEIVDVRDIGEAA